MILLFTGTTLPESVSQMMDLRVNLVPMGNIAVKSPTKTTIGQDGKQC
jgi:hypothetical protein